MSARADTIPIIDLGPYFAGAPGAIDRTAAELRLALTEIGFYFIVNHGVPDAQVRDVFHQAARFHAQPLEKKMEVRIDKHNVGYLPMRGDTLRTSTVQTVTRPNFNEALFVARDLAGDHPDVVADRRFRSSNRWPADLPGFREAVVAYCDAMERAALSVLPIYAVALDLPPDHFAPAFGEPQYTLRMSHYPHTPVLESGEYGLAPHADTSFMTLLAQNKVPGLSLRTASGRWIDAPVIEGAFLINSGQMLNRWSNGRFRATPHRVVSRSGGERYAIPFFFDCTIDHEMVCLPSCVDAAHPPKYEPTTYTQFMTWYQNQNYDHVRNAEGVQLQAN